MYDLVTANQIQAGAPGPPWPEPYWWPGVPYVQGTGGAVLDVPGNAWGTLGALAGAYYGFSKRGGGLQDALIWGVLGGFAPLPTAGYVAYKTYQK